MEKYDILVLFVFLLYLTSPVKALQDSNLTLLNSRGLCIRNGECQICENEVMILNGTEDHIIYLERKGLYDECATDSEFRNETFVQPLTSLIDMKNVYRIIFFTAFLSMGYYLYTRVKNR